MLDLLVFHTWWSYDRDRALAYSEPYHWFNLFEAAVWFVFAGAVFWRFGRHRHSRLELVYAGLFVAFGLTDLREAWYQQSWLIWLKLANLLALLHVRRLVMRRYYSASRLF